MKLTKRLLSVLLVLCMVLSMLPTVALFASAASVTWKEVAWSDITTDDTFIITITNSNGTYLMNSANGTSATPKLGYTGTITTTGGVNYCTFSEDSAVLWKRDASNRLCVAGDATKWIYTATSNNALRVGTSTSGNVWSQDGDYIKSNASSARYLSIYGTTDFRSYTSKQSGQVTRFFKAEATSSYTVTPAANNSSYGSVSLSGTTITATPAYGYYVTGNYTLSVAGAATVTYNNDNTFTVGDVTADCTVTIEFAAASSYTLTLSENGKPSSSSYYAGDSIELPKPSNEIVGEYTFQGWSDVQDVSKVTSPEDLYAAGSEYKMPAWDTTLYAVYAKETSTGGSGTGNYELLTSAQTDYSGSYIVAGAKSGNYYAMNPSLNAGTSTGGIGHASSILDLTGGSLMSSDNSSVLNTIDGQYVLTITATTIAGSTGYTLQDYTGSYLGHSSSTSLTKSTSTPTSASYLWTIDPTTTPATLKNVSTGYYLQFNSSNTTVFRTYSSLNTSYSLYLYKLTGGSTTTYSDWTTSVGGATLEYIEVVDPKTEYYVGDEFVTPTVNAVYSDKTTVDITKSCFFNGFDSGKAGKQTISITFVDDQGNVKTAAYEITIVERVAYTLTFVENGATSTYSYYAGDSVELPKPSNEIVGKYTFVGWHEGADISKVASPDDLLAPGTIYTMPEKDPTIYAVYAMESGGAAGLKAFSEGDTGDYVIVAETDVGYYALPTQPTLNSGKIAGVPVTVDITESGVLYVSTQNAAGKIWTIAADKYGYTVFDGTNYIYHSTGGMDGTNLAYGSDTRYTWSLTADGSYIKFTGVNDTDTTSPTRGLLMNDSYNFGGYSMSNWTAKSYYKTMILPIGGTSYTGWTTEVSESTEQYYTLFYDPNTKDEVTNMPPDSQNLMPGYYSFDTTVPVRKGYEFLGWGETPDAKSPIYGIEVTGDTTVYAIWAEMSYYYVSYFDSDYGNSIETTQYYSGQNIDAAYIPTPRTVEGYTFAGWCESTYDGNSMPAYFSSNELTGIMVYNDMTFHALYVKFGTDGEHWSTDPATGYTLTYNPNGGWDTVTNMPEDVSGIPEGTYTLDNTTIPVREGYVFMGWSINGYDDIPVTEIYISGDTTVYALWQSKYYVYYYDSDSAEAIAIKEYIGGQTIDEADVPTPRTVEGYTFVGWSQYVYEGEFEPSYTTPAGSLVYQNYYFYAVYARLGESAGAEQWTLVEDLSTVTAGTYALITPDYHAFNGTISSGHGQATTDSFVFDANGVASSAPAGTLELTLTASGDGYIMYNGTYGYLYASKASSGNLAWTSTGSDFWSYSGSNWTYNANSAYLRTFSNSSFRTYGNNSGSELLMAKKTAATTIEGYTTNPVAVTKYSVNFYSNSTDIIKTVSVKEGSYVSASDIPEIGTTVTNHTFIGWVVTPVTSTTVFPVLADPTVDAVTGDMNYYAVYVQHTQSYADTFYLQLKDQVNPYIFVGAQSGADSYASAVNSITDAMVFGVEVNDGNSYDLYYRDFAGSKIYVYPNASADGLVFSDVKLDGYHWLLEEAADGTITLQATNGTDLYLGYDVSTNSFNVLDEAYPHEFRPSSIKDYTSDPVEPDMVTVTWMSEGKVFTTTSVKENYTITAPGTNPTKADDETNHNYYTFVGWTAREGGEVITDFGIASAATNAIFYAVYAETAYATVNWVIDGVTETEYYKAGETPSHATPSKESDGTYSYIFSGWDPTPTAVTAGEEYTYTALFTQTEIQYLASLVLNPATVRVGKTATAVGKLSFGGTEVTDYAPVYTSSETAVATVDASTGAISALAVGTTEITVTYTVSGKNYTATQTFTVNGGTSGGYTLITQANAPEDFSGEYIIMGRHSGWTSYYNQFWIMTPYWINDDAAIVEDGESNSVLSGITGTGKTVASNNASEVSMTISGNTASGTINDAYSYGTEIEMECTGDNDFTGTNGTTYQIFDRITSIDDRFAFVIELVDDVNMYYTIRIKGTSYYLANTNTTASGNNGMQFVLDASTEDTTALWYIRWATESGDGLENNAVNGYSPDQVLIESVYGVENDVSRAILFNPNGKTASDGRFRVYGNNAYNTSGNLGTAPNDTQGSITYNLQLFGNPNPFNAQIYYQGDQRTIANPVELPQGMTAAADLESALTPDIANYPNWSLVGNPVWTLSDDSSGLMSIDASTGELLLNGAIQGAYSIVTVTYTVHDNINNSDHTISTQAKVVVTAPTETYSTIIYETASGNDTEVQYTVTAGLASLTLDYYVVNDKTGDNSKTGTVVEGGTPVWDVVSTNGYRVSISTSGVLDLSPVTGKDIIQVTLNYVTGNTVPASEASYKVYVTTTPKLAADTATITDNTTAITIDVLTNDQNLPDGATIYGLGKTAADIASAAVTENVTIGTFGSVSVVDGKVVYTPSAEVGDGDNVVFYYAVQDTDGTIYYAQVTVTADITNESPDVEPGDVIYNLVTKETVPDPDSYNFTGDYVFMGRKSGKMVDLNQFQVLTPNWTGTDVTIEENGTAAANNASFVVLGDITDNVATGTITTAYDSGATATGSYIRMESTNKYDFTDSNSVARTILDRITYIDEGFVLTIELVDDVNLYYTIRIKGTNYYLANANLTGSGNNGMEFTNSPSLEDTTMLWKLRWATAEDGLQTTDGYTPDQILIESVAALNVTELAADDVGKATLPLSRAILFNNHGWGATNIEEGSRFRVYGERAYANKLVSDDYGSGMCYNLFLFGAPVPFTAQIQQDGDVKTVADPVTVSAGRTADVDLQSLLLPDIDTEPNYQLLGEPVWAISGNSTTANGADIQLTDVNEGTFNIGSATEGAYAIVTVTYTVYDKVTGSTHAVSTDSRIVITAAEQSFNGVIYTGSESAPNTVSKNIVPGTPVELDYYVVDNMTSLTSLDPTCGFTVNNDIDADLVWLASGTSGNGYDVAFDSGTGKWTVDTTKAVAGEIITVTMAGAQAKLDGNLEYSEIANVPSFKIYVVDTLQLVADEATLSDLNALTIDVLANDLNLYADAQICGLGLTAADIAANLQTANVSIGTYGTVSVSSDNKVIFTPSITVAEGDIITFYYSVQGEDGTYYYAKVTITVDGLTAEGSLTTDTLVIDFGIPVTFNPTANDTGDFANAAVTGIMATNGGTAASPLALTEGTAVLNADGTVTFTPTKIMTAPAVFYYTVQYKEEVFTGTIQIIPATNVYYEDSMGDEVFSFTPTSAWATIGETDTTAQQRADFAGDISSNVYGYDDAYKGFATYSLGSAHVATVDANTTIAKVDFDFYGTGFDVISMTGGNSGYMIIAVCDYNNPSTVLYRYVVDTYYGFTFSEEGEQVYREETDADGNVIQIPVYVYEEVGDGNGDYVLSSGLEVPEDATVLESLNGEVYYYEYVGDGNGNYAYVPMIQHWIPSPGTSQSFYQVPVMKISDLDPGMYHVSIAAYYSKFYDHEEDGSYQFVFDAVRVYDPCGTDSTATDAYKMDGENEAYYLNLRDELINAKESESVETTESTSESEESTEPSTAPGTDTTEGYEGRYYIATIRSSGNYFYMTSNLGTASTKRYQAEDSGLTTLPDSIAAADVDAAKVFVLEKNNDGTYSIYAEGVEGDAKYLGWTSGNSGTLVAADSARSLTISESATVAGAVNISFDDSRYLSLNGTSGNDYFAWYTGTQKQDLTLIPIEGTAVDPDPTCEHANTTTQTVDPTCTEAGATNVVCSDCGTTVSSTEIAALGHSYESTVTDPTCTAAGYTTDTCSVCGDSYITDEVAATGHSYVDGTCSVCGAAEPTEDPTQGYEGRYYIATIRSSGNYFYMTNSLGTASTERYQAEDSGLTTLPASIAEADVDSAKVFVLELNDDGTYSIYAEGITDAAKYLGHTSGNSGTLVEAASALAVTVDYADGIYNIHYTASDAERYLALNGTSGNNYFAWYKSGQKQDLVLIPIEGEGTGGSTDSGSAGDGSTDGGSTGGSSNVDGTQPSGYSTTSNSGTRGVNCTSLEATNADSYYTGSYTYANLSTQTSSTLLSNLRSLTTDTHSTTTSYDDCKNYADNTDCQNEDGTVTLLYTGYQASTSDWVSGSNGWNREHVWPQSLGDFSTSGPGADLHHVRPDNTHTNSLRGNLRFGNVDGGTEVLGTSPCTDMLGGWRSSSYFEPLDSVKGDVARICLYMYVRYGGNSSYTCSDLTKVFESVDVLLEWHQLDPVDTWEMGRNVVVESIQGNRNPFIDYPELAWNLFGETAPDGYVTPSGSLLACAHSSTTDKTVAATCTNAGSVTVICDDCGETLSEKPIDATGHSYSYTITGNNHAGTCSSCGDTVSGAHTYVNKACVCGAQTMSIYFQNNWNWSDICLYYWYDGDVAEPDWPGPAMTWYGSDVTYNYGVYVMEVPTHVTGLVLNGLKDDGSGNRDQSPDVISGWYDGICYYMLYNNGNQVGSVTIGEMMGTSSVSASVLPYDLSNTTPIQTRSTEAPATRETTTEEGTASGLVFIDGNQAASLEEYEAHGPNNEIYLASNQAVAFNLSFTTEPKTIQIGLKSVEGNDEEDKASWFVVTCGSNRKTFKITTATEMYYDITDIVTLGIAEDGSYASAYPLIITKTNGDLGSLTYLKWTSAAANTASKATASTFLEEGDINEILEKVNEIVGNTEPNEETPEEPIAPPVEDETPDEPIAPPAEDETPVAAVEKFTDLDENAWYYEGVAYAVESGLMNGMSETEFMPDENLTRAMLVTILYRQAGSPEVGETDCRFTDVPANVWYYDAVIWAYESGITTGITDTEFGPDAFVTRQQMVTFLWRAADEPTAVLGYGENAPADVQMVAPYAQTAMAWAYENGIIKGEDGLLKPENNATRAQIANIFMRFEKALAMA